MSQWREREKTPRVDGGKNSPSRVEFPAPPVLQPSNEEPEDLSNPKGPLPTQQTASPATPEVQVTTSPNAIADEGTAKGPSKPEEHNPRETPPSKKKGKKFQLPREGPQEERREVPATPRRTRPQSPKSGRQQIGRNQIQACLPSPDIETDDPAATPHKERNSALDVTWPSGSPKTEISRRLQLIVSGPCPRLVTP